MCKVKVKAAGDAAKLLGALELGAERSGHPNRDAIATNVVPAEAQVSPNPVISQHARRLMMLPAGAAMDQSQQ